MLSIIVVALSIIFLFFFVKFVFVKKESYDNNPFQNFDLRKSVENELKNKNSFISEALKNSDKMVNSFIEKYKIRTDGYYVANIFGRNSELGIDYDLYFTLIFNNKNMFALVESENVPYNPTKEELNEFMELTEKNEFLNLDVQSFDIKMRIYEPDNHNAIEKGVINPNNYKEWSGNITQDGLILSYYKSYFDYSLNDYSIEQGAKDVKFDFHSVNL